METEKIQMESCNKDRRSLIVIFCFSDVYAVDAIFYCFVIKQKIGKTVVISTALYRKGRILFRPFKLQRVDRMGGEY